VTPRLAARTRAFLLVGATCLVALSLALAVIERRVPAGRGWVGPSPDTHEYVKMIRGERAAPPFSARHLVPFLASQLPLAPLEALRVVSDLSVLAGFWVLGLCAVVVLRTSLAAACLAVTCGITSTRGLLLLQNPFITDGFSFLSSAIMLALFLADRPRAFIVAAVIGVSGREDCLFGAFGFLATRRRVAGIVAAAAALAAYALPRLGEGGAASRFQGAGQLLDWQLYAKAFFAFGALWPVLLLGLWLGWRAGWRRLAPYAALLLAGSVASTFFAVDTIRMFLPLLPAVVVASALAFDRLRAWPWVLGAWLAVAAVNVGLALPGRLVPGEAALGELEDRYVSLAAPILAHQLAGLVLAAVTARYARRPAGRSA
jgi:hypothetical protein